MPESRKARILFIDDDAAKRYVIARQLRAHGFELDEAETGKQGLAMLSPEHDVVILDLKLPDMYGWDVCKKIKENPETGTVMVLELSAVLVNVQDRAKGLELGADAYLVHPVEIVELVAVINALVRLRRAVQERDLERELFIATASHDLRNPLYAISSGISILAMSPNQSDREREVIAHLGRNVDRMRRMIDQLLEFTQSLAGGFAIEHEVVELCHVCRLAIQDLEPPVDRAVHLHCDGEARIVGDQDRLVRVVENLVTNALRHGTGDVTVRVSVEAEVAQICVHNGGPPIPAEKMQSLFDPFKRGSKGPGSFGLGLSIVDRITRAHHGSVAVTSTQEEGTTFIVRLPLAEA